MCVVRFNYRTTVFSIHMAITWFPFYTNRITSKRIALVTAAVSLVIFLKLLKGHKNTGNLCSDIRQPPNQLLASVELRGGIGNLMFQYAFLYVTAKRQGLKMVIPKSKELNLIKESFMINTESIEMSDWEYDMPKKCFKSVEDEWDCKYDPKLTEHVKENVYYNGYFQSWKYFVSYEEDIRNMFRFHPHILSKAASVLHKIVKSSIDRTNKRPILVGVHIRRGDYITSDAFVEFGFNVADDTYLRNAMDFFRRMYDNVLFVACSNDIKWTKEKFGQTKDLHIVQGNSSIEDMALLSLTNHTIMTVGTFGWWISFLTNGITLYYRHPFLPGSKLGYEFGNNATEHLLPKWIGMDGAETF